MPKKEYKVRGNTKVLYAIIILIIILGIILSVYFKMIGENSENAEIAKCIGSKTTLYISEGCVACNAQKSIFGNNFKYLSVIDCLDNKDRCKEVLITVVPTWIIGDDLSNRVYGVHQIEDLQNITGC